MFSRSSNLFMVLGGEVEIRPRLRATIVGIMLIVIGGVQQVTAVDMEAGTWTQKADMPTARSCSGAAVVDGKIYVIGGSPAPAEDTAAVEEYNPATGTWTAKADMPISKETAAAVVDGIIYAIGGWSYNPRGYLTTVEAYDPVADKWTKKANTSVRRSCLSASVVDGKIYVIGGRGCGVPSCSAVEVYDPATNTWIMKASMPTGVGFHAACVVDGRICVFGGTPEWDTALATYSKTLPTVQIYDPAANTWTQASDMPRPRMGHTASLVDGKIYLIGGYDYGVVELWKEGKIDDAEAGKLFSIVDVYDPETDTWATAADIPLSIDNHTAAVVSGRIYVIGGETGPQSKRLSDVYEFTPGLPHAVSSVSPAGKLLETWGQVKKVQ